MEKKLYSWSAGGWKWKQRKLMNTIWLSNCSKINNKSRANKILNGISRAYLNEQRCHTNMMRYTRLCTSHNEQWTLRLDFLVGLFHGFVIRNCSLEWIIDWLFCKVVDRLVRKYHSIHHIFRPFYMRWNERLALFKQAPFFSLMFILRYFVSNSDFRIPSNFSIIPVCLHFRSLFV